MLEYLNGSNTGKLLLSTPNARLFILGIEEQEKELVNWIVDDLHRTVVLFPSQDSLTVDQFKAKRPSDGALPQHHRHAHKRESRRLAHSTV